MTTRLGVNLLYLVPGVVGGTENYAVRVLRAVAAHPDRDIEIVLFANEAFTAAYPDIGASFAVAAPRLPGGRPVRVVAESTWLVGAARARGVTLLHHFGGRVPVRAAAPGVVTVHDLQPLDRPQSFSMVKRMFLGYSLPRSVRKARRVVAVSEWVRSTIIDRLGVPPERTAVMSAPCPVVERASLIADERVRVLPAALRGIVESRAPYFVYPAIAYEHKNHRTLLDAFAYVAREHPHTRLVLTGGAGPIDEEIDRVISERHIADRVVRAGLLPRDQLDTVIARARALTFPSLYEGFGLPVIEALALGCPPIVANATALPEAAGGCGVLVDPLSVDAWATALSAALDWDRSAIEQLLAPASDRLAALQPEVVAPRWLALHRLVDGSVGG